MALGKILVVDDDKNICELLRLYLEKEGYSVILAHDGEEALLKFETLHPELILLDIMLPGLDGWQVCREIRKKSQVPIIMLTAKGETFDKVLGLELGADDYVVKPFGVRELVARVKALLRRSGSHKQEEQPTQLSAAGITLDLTTYHAMAGGERLQLTLKEFELLRLLASRRGMVLTRDDILQAVWDYDFAGETRTVDMHVKTLRQKLGDGYIQTVRGVGYKMP